MTVTPVNLRIVKFIRPYGLSTSLCPTPFYTILGAVHPTVMLATGTRHKATGNHTLVDTELYYAK